jgi:hypothetical protein
VSLSDQFTVMSGVIIPQDAQALFYHRAFPSRISTFPLELLEYIFDDCMQFGITQADDWTVPLTLSHVCRHWRHAVHNSSRLWTTIVMNGTQASRERVPFWFGNSAGHLIDVVVSKSRLHLKVGRVILAESFAVVASGAPRWRTLNMTLGVKAFGALKHLCSKFSLTVERLETLQISAPRGRESWQLVKDLTFESSFIADAPRLRTFILRSCRPIINRDAPPSWATHVTHLELNKLHVPWTSIYDILHSFPLLQKLVLDVSVSGGGSSVSPNQRPINLHDLRDLTVSYPATGQRFIFTPSCLGIFSHLSAPSLSVLSLKDLRRDLDVNCDLGWASDRFVADMLYAVLSKHPPLRSLSLDNVVIYGDGLIRILTIVPFLEELSLARSPLKLSFLVKHGASIPLLSTLTIRECHGVSPATVTALLHTRSFNNNTSPIQHLHIDCCCLIMSSDADAWRESGGGRLTVNWS